MKNRTKKKLYSICGIVFISIAVIIALFSIFSKNLVEEAIEVCIKNKEEEANFLNEDFSDLCTCFMEGQRDIFNDDEYKKMLKLMKVGEKNPQSYAFFSTMSKDKKEKHERLSRTCILEYAPIKSYLGDRILACVTNSGKSIEKCRCLHMGYLEVLGERKYKLFTLSKNREELKEIGTSFEEMVKIDNLHKKCND